MKTALLERRANIALQKIDNFMTQLQDAREGADTVIDEAESEITRLNLVVAKCNKVKKFVNALFAIAKK